MNKMTPKEWAAYKADFIAFVIVPMLVFAVLVLTVDPEPVTLVNNPCAPHQPVTVNGEDMGCTGRASYRNVWVPDND